MPDNVDVIITEIGRLRDLISDKMGEHGERLAALEARLKPILGNGHPGVLEGMQKDIDDLKLWQTRIMVYLGILSGAVSLLVTLHDHIFRWLGLVV